VFKQGLNHIFGALVPNRGQELNFNFILIIPHPVSHPSGIYREQRETPLFQLSRFLPRGKFRGTNTEADRIAFVKAIQFIGAICQLSLQTHGAIVIYAPIGMARFGVNIGEA
jgi:hypothetical protein